MLGKYLFAVFAAFLFAVALSLDAEAGTDASVSAVSCPAAGSSVQVFAAKTARHGLLLLNQTAVSVRVGFLGSGTANLTDSNSFVLQAGASYSDNLPGVFIGRVVCMSTDATPRSIYAIQINNP